MGWGSAVKNTVDTPRPSRTDWVRPEVVCAKVNLAKVVTIDFETYFDKDYTLKKLSTSEYVRDERFKVLMMGIKVGQKRTRVVPGAHVAKTLAGIDWSTHSLLCHNTAFDGLILQHHFNVIPAVYYDTLSMARGLHSNDIGAGLDEVARYYGVGNKIPDVLDQVKGVAELPKELYARVAQYCAMDVDLCFEIFQRMNAQFPASELALVDLTVRMFCEPVLRVDLPRVEQELKRELAERDARLLSVIGDDKEIKRLSKTFTKHQMLELAKKELGSNEKFAQLLRDAGVEPQKKISAAWIAKKPAERDDAKKWSYAFAKTDDAMMALLEHDDDYIRTLAECRLDVKSTNNTTRAERFLRAGSNGWKLPVGLSYARAHTLRWGGNNKMNMQNLQRGGELRKSILAPEDHVIVVRDSGQIEARVNAWLWGQEDLLEAFRVADAWEAKQSKLPKAQRQMATGDSRDAYCRFADSVYGFEVTKKDEMERFVGKVSVLGLGFQMGVDKFQTTLAKGALGGPPVHFDKATCSRIVMTYRRRNHKIVAGWAVCNQIIEDMAAGRTGEWKCLKWERDKVWLPNGMTLKYPGLKKSINEDSGFEEWTYTITRDGRERRTKIYGGLLCENFVQALARLIVAEQMLAIHRRWRVVMMTHDEVIAIAHKDDAEKCLADMGAIMSTPPAWCADIPLNSEGGYAENYSK